MVLICVSVLVIDDVNVFVVGVRVMCCFWCCISGIFVCFVRCVICLFIVLWVCLSFFVVVVIDLRCVVVL